MIGVLCYLLVFCIIGSIVHNVNEDHVLSISLARRSSALALALRDKTVPSPSLIWAVIARDLCHACNIDCMYFHPIPILTLSIRVVISWHCATLYVHKTPSKQLDRYTYGLCFSMKVFDQSTTCI